MIASLFSRRCETYMI